MGGEGLQDRSVRGERADRLRDALGSVMTSEGSRERIVRGWSEAEDVLRSVLELPSDREEEEEEEEESKGRDTRETEADDEDDEDGEDEDRDEEQGRDTTRETGVSSGGGGGGGIKHRPKRRRGNGLGSLSLSLSRSSTSTKSGLRRYRDMISASVEERTRRRRLSASLWRTVSSWPVPKSLRRGKGAAPAPGGEAGAEAANEEGGGKDLAAAATADDDEDDAEDRLDRVLEERIAGAVRTARSRMRAADDALDSLIRTREEEEERRQLRRERAREEEESAAAASAYEAAQREEEARERAESLLRPMTPEEAQKVRDAVRGRGREDDVLASAEGGDSVSRRSMRTLRPGAWINDEVLHYFLYALSRRDEERAGTGGGYDDRVSGPGRGRRCHFFKSFFMTKLLDGNGGYSYKNVRRWSKKVPGGDVFELDKIFFPVNVGGMHWTCVVADVTRRTVSYYDSMGDDGDEYTGSVFRYLCDEHVNKRGGTELADSEEWKILGCSKDTPRQENCELHIPATLF